MKTMMSGLFVMLMAFALVSGGKAQTATPYSCGIESPAYTDYTNARAIPCDRGQDPAGSTRTPDPMGSPGY